MEVDVERSEKFSILYDLPPGTHTVICIGGRGGMKTYEVSKFVAYSATIKKKRCVILRDEKALIKESILNEVWARYDTANDTGILDQFYQKNETELKDRKTGQTLVYTKGFRASDNQKKANLKGSSQVDIAVVEEAEDIVDPEKFYTFVDSLREDGCVTIMMLNTPSLGHFIVKQYFNARQVIDGYFELIPKNIPGVVFIQTSYKDNPYLPAHVVDNYEGAGKPEHHRYDLHYYYTSILGYSSAGRKGQIFTKVKPISLADYLKLPYREIFGQDFGTASPAATIGAKFDGNRAYVRLLNYKPLPVLEIGKMYSKLKLNKSDRIICDYAEPDSIDKLSNGWRNLDIKDYQTYPELAKGFFAVPCPTKDINGHLSLMSSMEIYAVEEDIELWTEINNYCYAQDKYKNYTDDPIDDYNHALDAFRYVCADQRGKNKLYGI